MNRENIKSIILGFSCAVLLTACESAKEDLGLTRQAPDEFSVIRRAPLELPPDYSLRPPRPGAERPQEVSAEAQAKQTVFGTTKASKTEKPTTSEELLLQKTGADEASENIRQTVDQEAASMEGHEQPVAKRLLGLGGDDGPPATIVDAEAEATRLRQNKEEGKAATEGETPSIED